MNKFILLGIAFLIVIVGWASSASKPATAPIVANDAKDWTEKSKIAALKIYVVQDGDTLPKIAALFGVPVSTIVWDNDLSNNSALQVGRALYIPPLNGVRYTVEPGDTLRSIAEKFHISAVDIETLNGVDASLLRVGSEIIIPNALPFSHD